MKFFTQQTHWRLNLLTEDQAVTKSNGKTSEGERTFLNTETS